MTTLTIQIPGQEVPNKPTENTENLTIENTYSIGTLTRGEPEGRHTIQLDESKVVEFVFSDNTVWFGDHTNIDEVFPGTTAQLRSIEQRPENNIFLLPKELYVDEQSRSSIVSKITLKLVKVFTKKAVLSPLVSKLAGELEEKQTDGRSGLYKLTKKFDFEDPTFAADGHYLLFLHGTASSTTGSFSELKTSTTWNYIHEAFEEKVLAFEHETLTQSPLQNVLALVKKLPQKATLTVISHSRGGLVGDILNRFCIDHPTQRGFSANEKNYLRKHDRDNDLLIIEQIEKAILGKNIRINKFIRVASTASGTSLASRRLNIYFNVIFNLVGLASGQSANPIYATFKNLIAALIESKDDASVLPGLEVQNPTSPFNQMLNNSQPEAIINTPLIVISGDAKMTFSWQALKVVLSNMFFWNDNDFVVDTRSMYNGARRADGAVQYFFDEGGMVSHFNYFKNDTTQSALLLALKSTGNKLIPGFSKLETRSFTGEEIRNIELNIPGGRLFHDTVSGKKPIVVLLPGIMGSTLSVNDRLVWINFLGFVRGSLTRLQHSVDNNNNVRADGLVASSYNKLATQLKRDYDVVTFPFDWRTHMAQSAGSLNRKIEQLMEFGQPIKLIGHSMGGVLIRDFILNHPSTWEKLKGSKDFKLLFLGSPLGGSFRILYVLFGLDALIKKLDFIDFTNSMKELIEIFSAFPGLLSLLPLTTDPDNDFANPAIWRKIARAFGDESWPVPGETVLGEFKNYRNSVTNATIDYSNAVYIAGQSRKGQQTISGYQITKKGSREVLEFLATKEGDESVTWSTGIPATMLTKENVYYSDVTHGELANDPKLFGAISDILRNGSTSQLKRTPPALRSVDREFKAKEIFDFDLSPNGVEATLLGLGTDTGFHAGTVPINVFVSNGDVKYAMYPVVVGHFAKDGILFAEKAIDQHLNRELTSRHLLGLYPGEIGTNEIVLNNQPYGIKGAIVVGLGKQGQLTEHRLTSTVEHAISRYLADLNFKKTTLTSNKQPLSRVGLTVLLIGSHYGGLSIESSVRAILQGVQNANVKVSQTYTSSLVIDTVEFGELYKDRALACMKALNAIEKEETRSLNIIFSTKKIKENIGWRERIAMDNTSEWWTRIHAHRQIEATDSEGKCTPSLRFAISTDAARVEERFLTTINDTLLEMLSDLSTKDDWSPELARSIFEMMIPNDFKDQVKRQGNINWILDKYTAAFPWELLQDSAANSLPLSVNAGMIRQLTTGDYRININPVMERTAIVIADPDLKNPAIQLPAARKEGESVARLLHVQGFNVNPIFFGTAAQILANLFNKNYKIVHLAGHGIFSSEPCEPSGMMIGPNAFLTPAYIDQMSNVPELVFVNCCYLGQMDSFSEEYARNRFRLAANIGTQLIEIGVKAVVVAGWAVNDSAALDFAETFYHSMFQGNNFGEATQKARKRVFEKFPRTNTWGAYQCYGDPFYQLENSLQEQKMKYEFIIAEEAEIELRNLLNNLGKGGYDTEDTLLAMEAIDKAVSSANLQNGRITELQAFLYSSLNKYDLAVSKFNDLFKEEKAAFSFVATEKFCNTQIKLHAEKVSKARKEGEIDPQVIQNALSATRSAITNLEALKSFGETIERLNLLGSAYKRMALLTNDQQEKKNAYECAGSFYRKAYDVSRKYYALTNWLSIEIALVSAHVHDWGQKELSEKQYYQDILTKELENIQLKQEEEKEYWDWIAEATILLCQALIGDKSVTIEILRDKYSTAWKMVGSEGQKQTEIEQLEFLEDAFAMGQEESVHLLEFVKTLKSTLEVCFEF